MEVLKNEVEYAENEQQEEIDVQSDDVEVDLKELMADNLMISVDISNLSDIKFNEKRFQKGIDDISYVCGIITGLINVGVTAVDALAYVMAEHSLENNIEINKIASDAEVEKSKIKNLQSDKNDL